jgi:hypothetical protein
MATLSDLRQNFHASMFDDIYGVRLNRAGSARSEVVAGRSYPVYSNADGTNATSVVYAAGVAERLLAPAAPLPLVSQTVGSRFEHAVRGFLSASFELFGHFYPHSLTTGGPPAISAYAQFQHLEAIQRLVEADTELWTTMGEEYLVKPDILVSFEPVGDDVLNESGAELDDELGRYSAVRSRNSPSRILHASISCKWTMRSDRAQNVRLEALNLVRNRKGRLPHIAAVTMECDPAILGSLCLGTGDIDCLYHPALPELLATADDAAQTLDGRTWQPARDSLHRMVEGGRIRDISDLPLDLLI